MMEVDISEISKQFPTIREVAGYLGIEEEFMSCRLPDQYKVPVMYKMCCEAFDKFDKENDNDMHDSKRNHLLMEHKMNLCGGYDYVKKIFFMK